MFLSLAQLSPNLFISPDAITKLKLRGRRNSMNTMKVTVCNPTLKCATRHTRLQRGCKIIGAEGVHPPNEQTTKRENNMANMEKLIESEGFKFMKTVDDTVKVVGQSANSLNTKSEEGNICMTLIEVCETKTKAKMQQRFLKVDKKISM